MKFRDYYHLTKPGIIRGNILMTVAGYLFAAGQEFDIAVFLSLVAGTSLVIASACVFNNILDRNIDAKMERTRKRVLVSNAVSVNAAAVFGTLLLVIGAVLLGFYVNTLALLIALVGHFAYVILYTFIKRVSVHGTLVGTISGSTPPVIGYVAATNTLDITALMLFVLLIAWQMPHFFAIAIFRLKDYQSANIPVLPAIKGLEETRKQIILYSGLFVATCLSLSIVTQMSPFASLLLLIFSGYWFYKCCLQPDSTDTTYVVWAKRQFLTSLVVLLSVSVTLSIQGILLA